MRQTIALSVLCLLASAGVAGATPSTLIWIPSTDVQAEGTRHLGVDNYFPPGEGESLPVDVGLTLGARRVEYGFDWFGGEADPLQFNGKVLLLDQPRSRVRAVVGAYAVGTNRDTTGYDIVYALASKELPFGRVTAGYGVGDRDLLAPDHDMVLLGWDRTLNDRWWVAADYQSGKSAFGALSVGAAYTVAPNASVILGFVDLRAPGSDDMITTQVDVNF
jgi:hypothetical protein